MREFARPAVTENQLLLLVTTLRRDVCAICHADLRGSMEYVWPVVGCLCAICHADLRGSMVYVWPVTGCLCALSMYCMLY